MQISLSTKQIQTLKLFDDPTIVDYLYGGGAGGSKSMTVCIWIVIQLRQFRGIRIGLGRKELTRLKQTTVHTLLHEVHPILGIGNDDYVYNEQKSTITYVNGSSIQLVDLAWMPSDPDYDRFGSLNFTHTVVEEGGEVTKKAKDVFTSRRNRYLNGKYDIVGKSITTCNPSQNFLKLEYYKPYNKLGGGAFQKWEHGQVEIKGELVTAYQCFIRSLATDNPFLPRNYIETLRQLPLPEKRRLLEGNWDYGNDDFILFKSMLIDRSMTDIVPNSNMRFIGVDISDAGDDETILSMVEGNTLVDQKKISVDKDKAIGEQIALEIIKYAQQNGIDANQAHRIAIDTLGVGASTRDFMRSKGWRIKEFIAGGAATNDMFRNLRGQSIYTMSQQMDSGEFKIYSRLPMWEELRTQLMAHEYTTEERRILIKPKDDIKKVLGRSPDNAESAYIAFWVSRVDNGTGNVSAHIIF